MTSNLVGLCRRRWIPAALWKLSINSPENRLAAENLRNISHLVHSFCTECLFKDSGTRKNNVNRGFSLIFPSRSISHPSEHKHLSFRLDREKREKWKMISYEASSDSINLRWKMCEWIGEERFALIRRNYLQHREPSVSSRFAMNHRNRFHDSTPGHLHRNFRTQVDHKTSPFD